MPPLLIVAHGQPSNPAPAAAELAGFAARVAALLPDCAVLSATLAEPEALPRAIARLGPGGAVFPLFMAGGWFTRINLPAKLHAAGAQGWRVLEPLGCDPALHDLAVTVVTEALAGQDITRAEVLLAAHGSGKSPVPAVIAERIAHRIAALGLARAEARFIEQSPRLETATGFGPAAICLPFFAASGNHVSEDLPQALALAGFPGRILPALGLDARVPCLVAAAAQAERWVCPGDCRHAAP